MTARPPLIYGAEWLDATKQEEAHRALEIFISFTYKGKEVRDGSGVMTNEEDNLIFPLLMENKI